MERGVASNPLLAAWLLAMQLTACGSDTKSGGATTTSEATSDTGSDSSTNSTNSSTDGATSSASTGDGTSSGGAASSGGGATSADSGGTASSSGGAGDSTGGSSTGGGSNAGGAGGALSGGSGGGGTGGVASGGQGGTGTAACSDECQTDMQTCCDGTCRDTYNDPLNCGSCGTRCEAATPYCAGECQPAPCNEQTTCEDGESCCGSQCCAAGQLCCYTAAGAFDGPACADPVDGTCPPVCWLCGCAHPETPIATPQGEVPIAELRVGDLVYSVDREATVVVPITRIRRLPVRDHHVQALRLDNGRQLFLSADHPTAKQQAIGALGPGQRLGEVAIVSVEQVPYDAQHTYDILPASDTGTYFAGGALVGSTLFLEATDQY